MGISLKPITAGYLRACVCLWITPEQENAVVERLYARAGILPTGEIEEGQAVARRGRAGPRCFPTD